MAKKRDMKIARFLKTIQDEMLWAPRFTEIGRRLNMPVSSVYDLWSKLEYRVEVKVKILDPMDLVED